MALVCTAIGGAAAQAVAASARLLASLPGAALPWPDGPAGALAMAVTSAVNSAALWVGLSPAGRRAAARLARGLTDSARAAAASTSGLGRGARRGRVDR